MRVRLATALLVVLGACGRSEPSYRGRTVAHWVGALGGEPAAAAEAQAALVGAAAKDPEPVLRELERALRSEPEPVVPTTFVLALDPEAATREGLPPMPAEEAVHLDLGPVRNRAAALGEPVNLRGRREGFVEVTARSRPPEDLQRLQRAP